MERLFAEGKEQQGLSRTLSRGLEAMLWKPYRRPWCRISND
ncbi:MAG: hypothetical protein BSOLF_2826 [Candidatus Carbobacillus altaicus]|uniref:Uncharacterized protein n=1 Tax=Candidatus Carbonibacillus altaicus TaxID=2163959 RepID=A0A2R6Y1W7_9BACL|nr:MAG: hypothetical protein BSOLF_2826 [Candidatus Carbobacillus altaicus]